MKTTGTFKLIGSVVISIFIGFLIGISVDFPRINNQELSGAIAKVKNFRNVKVGEEDIKLKNELIGDTVRLNSLKRYINYYYLKKAHDLLLLSEINTSVMNDDKNLQKWLSDKKMLSDVEKLSWWDSETLKGLIFLDNEKLNGIEITDAEKIGLILDKESLNRLMDDVTLNSEEKLGA